jgi:hypothetical protein
LAASANALTVRRATIFVLSDVRSGSTLLDQCLGAHPEVVSLGEVHWLDAYLTQNRDIYNPVHDLICTCGALVTDCPFWRAVEGYLGRPLGSLRVWQRLNRRRNDKRLLSVLRSIPRQLVKVRPRLYRRAAFRALVGGPRVARDCIALYDAVSSATGRAFCVDSSKTPYRFRDVYERDRGRSRAVILTRDYRAVVHSKMKRGQSLVPAASGWRLRMEQIRELTSDLPREDVHSLSYEALCTQPAQELANLCTFLGIAFADSMMQRPTGNLHHIGGSPSKFDPDRARISLDDSFARHFREEELRVMRELVGEEARRWGYDA